MDCLVKRPKPLEYDLRNSLTGSGSRGLAADDGNTWRVGGNRPSYRAPDFPTPFRAGSRSANRPRQPFPVLIEPSLDRRMQITSS